MIKFYVTVGTITNYVYRNEESINLNVKRNGIITLYKVFFFIQNFVIRLIECLNSLDKIGNLKFFITGINLPESDTNLNNFGNTFPQRLHDTILKFRSVP